MTTAPPAAAKRAFLLFHFSLDDGGELRSFFNRHRLGLDHDYEELSRRAEEYRAGGGARKAAEYLRERLSANAFEIDSCLAHWRWIDVLAEAFPEARFLFTYSDCYSWGDAYLDRLVRRAGMAEEATGLSVKLPGSDLTLLKVLGDEGLLLANLGRLLDRLFGEWGEVTRAGVEGLPAGRSLAVRTGTLASQAKAVTRLLGIPEDSVTSGGPAPGSGRAPRQRLLERGGRALVEGKAREHCGPLMDRLFPGLALDAALKTP